MARVRYTAAHWGFYEGVDRDGQTVGLRPFAHDPDPSPIGLAMWDAYRSGLRIARPAVRESWWRHGPGGRPELRGREGFVEVDWETAIRMVADELQRIRLLHGPEAIFGGSYGWSSAGRFHHAQSQVHRFLNACGGYVRSVDSYSLGAARVLMPHVVASMDELMVNTDPWEVLAAHTRLMVAFGGAPAKNAQVSAGGVAEHRLRAGLRQLAAAGCRLVHISPVRAHFDAPEDTVQWVPIRPNTDAAAMLAMATETVLAGRHDKDFLARYCEGSQVWIDMLLGRTDGVLKNADWAAPITGIPAATLRELAQSLSQTRSLINVAWSLQRAEHGEQPFWAAVNLACLLGQIGLPGGGFAGGYGPANLMGSPHRRIAGPTLPQGQNPVKAFIPVARIADMLLKPGEPFTYNGQTQVYPDIRLIYWAGGNPFHHHQDLHRLARAWQRPQTIVVHEQFWNANAKMADIVLPATSTLERDDIGFASREPAMVAMKAMMPVQGQARDDYNTFAELAERMGVGQAFTEGRNSAQWLRHLYEDSARQNRAQGLEMPDFDTFWAEGIYWLPAPQDSRTLMSRFRDDPQQHRLRTPSGRIEMHSATIAAMGLADCPGHASWLPPREWLGSPLAKQFPLHLISDQPHTKLHSQIDHSYYSQANKRDGREPLHLHPQDALVRGIADGDAVRVFNTRGACLATAAIDEGLLPGVVRLSTGAWWDTEQPGDPAAACRHGNPNTLTQDVPASQLSQGCAAQSCLVQIERCTDPAAPTRAFALPALRTS